MNNLDNILKKFSDVKITVIGDIMLDKTIFGNVSRLSPEAPVPVLKVIKEEYSLGGAGNVVSNISSLGGKCSFFGFVGKDESARILSSILDLAKVKYFFGTNKLTTLKVRHRQGNHQFLRVDYEDTSKKIFESRILQQMEKEISESDLILISDYDKGAITSSLMNFLKQYHKKIIVDPKPPNTSLFFGIYLITPNEKEALQISNKQDVISAGRLLKKRLKCNVLVTCGENGMYLFSDNESQIPTYAREVYDVEGAGDTAIAAISLSIASGASLSESAIIANYAAGIAVEKQGTYSVKLNELEHRILFEEKKIVNLEQIEKIIFFYRVSGSKIVWTNGCYDILHIGHKATLENAKKQGDILVLGLDSDKSIRKLKGKNRPINDEKDRAELLASMNFIDYITIYPEGGAYNYIQKLKPDIYFKGGDYTLDTINQEERKLVESYGGKIVFGPKLEGKSTTKTIDKIKNSHEK